MSKWLLVLLFVAGAALAWGVYVPVVHRATLYLQSSLRAFLCVGIAYFLVAVLVPLIMIVFMKWDPTIPQKGVPNFALSSVCWGLLAGVAGALGALCVIFASKAAGPLGPIVVAPLVFGGAPIINTIVSIYYFNPVKTLPDWKFFTGIGLAAIGAVMVMVFKPTDAAHASPAAKTAVKAPAEAGAAMH